MSVNEKMTAIADEIRKLSSVTGTMSLDKMASNLEKANDYVSDAYSAVESMGAFPQTYELQSLAAQILSIPSKQKTVTLSAPSSESYDTFYYIDADGNKVKSFLNQIGTITICAPSFICFEIAMMHYNYTDYHGYYPISGISLFQFRDVCVGYVDGSEPVVFGYKAADNEPV